MSYACKILLDSISETRKRLTTMEITFPRIVLSEFNTHRMFSRNSASSRAIPFSKQIERVKTNPFIPEQFPLNYVGMQPQEYVTKNDPAYKYYVDYWLGARNNAVSQAVEFFDLKKPHKQIVNRLIEPFMWHTVIVTSTEWDNFFKLRCDENAQYEIRRIADLIYEAYYWEPAIDYSYCQPNQPISFIAKQQKLSVGEWHCPLVSEEDEELIKDFYRRTITKIIPLNNELLVDYKKRISVARCARVSYLTHDGKRDIEKDLELFERLRTSGHYSPFEHVAQPYFREGQIKDIDDSTYYGKEDLWSANFLGWRQYRKDLPNENCTNFRKEN